jgi:toxin ParE1/3/4
MAEREVRWAASAEADLTAIVDFIAETDPAAALSVLRRIRARALTLARLDARGRTVPELRDSGVFHHRELVERPWRMIYRVESDRVFIVAVLDARRQLQTLLLERLVRA